MTPQENGIQWTDFTANLIKYRDAAGKSVWACVKCSDGCKNCYAEALAKRYGRGGPFSLAQIKTVTPYFDEKEANTLLKSPKLKGKRVFIGDMTDVFGDWVPFELLDRMFAVFALRPDVTFQVLTKRPERMAEYFDCFTRPEFDGTIPGNPPRKRFSDAYMRSRHYQVMSQIGELAWEAFPIERSRTRAHDLLDGAMQRTFPLSNVWLGCSVEDQKAADTRIPHLLRCPAATRFISQEPQLSEVIYRDEWAAELHWIIVGGESGPGAREFDTGWAHTTLAWCRRHNVKFFMKQTGSKVRIMAGDAIQMTHAGMLDSGKRRTSKGGDILDIPPALRVREFPQLASQ